MSSDTAYWIIHQTKGSELVRDRGYLRVGKNHSEKEEGEKVASNVVRVDLTRNIRRDAPEEND